MTTPAISLATAEAKLALWLEADDAVAANQSYTIAGRTLTRADANVIASRIAMWERRVEELRRMGGQRRRGPTMRGVRFV